ncbi:MAG: DUF4332 domain-containing protein [Planctomycetaceae bacterium]|nr:DUF4332 domain-containing protein [Planctomycetaceae bacterium]
MSLLLNVIFSAHARSTHHKLALDALKLLSGEDAERWTLLLLSQHQQYLKGAKAPDDDFRDFRNHVLHVRDNDWGGAVSAANDWYGQFIDHLRSEQWSEAAYAAGVLSHYFSDPHMPFHTGQSESEGAVHRAAEWSVTKSYEQLREIIESQQGGYPTLKLSATPYWLKDLLRSGAVLANSFYESLIDHYNLDAGLQDPPAGLDDFARDAVATCLAHATAGFALVLRRALDESGVQPPEVSLTLSTILATVRAPMRRVLNGIADSRDRREVESIWNEVQETGKAIRSLPDSERLVREFHCEEVLRIPLAELDRLPARPAGQQYFALVDPTPVHAAPDSRSSRPSQLQSTSNDLPNREPALPDVIPLANHSGRHQRYYLQPDDPIVDAPSIGTKTARRFHAIGIQTVREFLVADPETLAVQLATGHITAERLRDWQDQSRLMMTVPGLRGHDAQLLVADDVRNRESLSVLQPNALLTRMMSVADSVEGRRILRNMNPPDLTEVTEWISAAEATSDRTQNQHRAA